MSSGFGVFTLDTAGQVRSWNQWLAEATGVSEAVACRLTAAAVVAPSRAELIGDVLNEVLGTGVTRVLSPGLHRYLVLCPPSRASAHFAEMQQLVTVAPLRSDEGIVGAMVTIEDVTDRLTEELEMQAAATGDGHPLSALGSADWRVRAAAAGSLRQSASREQVAELLVSLQRDHHDFSVLNSALQVLMGVNRDVTIPLGELLTDRDPNVRMHAALALGNIGSEASVPGLIAALDDPDQNVRFHAIEALGRMRSVAAVEPLARIAQGGDFFLAFPAIDALAAIDDASVMPALVGLMDQELLRPAIVDALAEQGDEDCVVPLTALLNRGGSDSPVVAAALARIAARYEDAYEAGEQIADLVRLALTDEGVEQVCADLRARRPPQHGSVTVAAWAGPPALDALLSLLDDGGTQPQILEALRRIGRPAVMPLAARLRDGRRDAAVAAASVLGQLGDRRAVPDLVAALSSHDGDLVAAAATALGQLRDADTAEPLMVLFADSRVTVRQAAIAALQSIGSGEVTAGARARMRDPDPRVRESAVRVAGYFGFDDCRGLLAEAAADADEAVRRAVIEQLPLIDDSACADWLVAALRTDVPRNRAAAARALQSVAAPAVVPALIAALDDDDPWVRYFAAASLEEQGTRACADVLAGLARSDPAPPVRIAATRAASTLAPDLFAAHAPALAADDDDEVAAAAIAALGGTDDASVDVLLEHALQGARPALSLAAVEALGRRATPAAVQMLAWAARLPEPAGLATAAAAGLRRVAVDPQASGRAAAVAGLVGLAGDPVRREPVLRLLRALPADLLGALEQELQSPRPERRAVVVEAIARMRHPDATQTLTRALADEHPLVRSAAVAAFGRLGSPLAAATIAAMAAADADPAVRRRARTVCRRYGWDDTPGHAR